MLPLKSGPNWEAWQPKPQDSLCPKLLLALLNLMINIVVSMLEMRTLTLSLLMSLTPSLKNTMVSLLVSNTHLTWMSTKSMAILTQLHPFTAPGSVLEGALKVSDFPPELLVIKDWVLNIS